MKEIIVNVDSYNENSIRTVEGDNLSEVYKIYILKNKRRIDLTNKIAIMAYVNKYGNKKSNILALNIANAAEGEIELPITNVISNENGVYACQIAIYGENNSLEQTAPFSLIVENNIFSDITKAIADSKDFTYLENILDKASKLSEKLKENTSSATNANSNLESNITAANNINSKILENTSTATSLNKNLESNIDLAKEVKETIKDLDIKNIEATEKIQTLTGLNSKAEELSDNINKGLPLNAELIKSTESAKAANTNLAATNQEATTKNTELQASLEKTKEFIEGLDGSQNIPQLRLDVTELQNGLKSNQALEYQGSCISADNTLEGRTEGMRIKGRTLQNLVLDSDNYVAEWVGNNIVTQNSVKTLSYGLKPKTTYTRIIKIEEINGVSTETFLMCDAIRDNDNAYKQYQYRVNKSAKIVVNTFTTGDKSTDNKYSFNPDNKLFKDGFKLVIGKIMIIEGDWTNKPIPQYFEGIKSFGEQEGNKISILSSGKNLFDGELEIGSLSPSGINQDDILNRIRTKNYIDIKGLSTIFISSNVTGALGIRFYDSTKKCIGTSVPGVGNRCVRLDIIPNTHYIRFSHVDNTDLSTKYMISETAINIDKFEPYKEDKKDILIKEPLHEGNYLYEDNGQVKVYKEAKKYIFNGDENWSKHSNSGNGLFVAIIWDGFSDCSPTSSVVCNKLKNERTTSKENVIYFVSKCPIITVSEKTIGGDTVEHFKTWLKSNPIEIIYQLATPTVEVVENCVDIDLDTYQDKTYFSINNTIPGSLDFKVPSNIGSVVQNMAKEVNNIWDVINNLLVPSILDVNKKVALATIKNNLK
ncbi:BppU family phage baseplate upper protein [Clostridium perfringens]|uniref:BppU family phage baseplate upper protein n=1 Tax=Clostridium perfringens TaxID=1502 RepID=UPI000D70F17E|nr:BppU family phage baseplate upper protein [Clostridium perfringens]PWW86606.1 DUF2479 domain-containing protein [Clostridium perfringens]PWX64978.1 DUF2479 domain-containing protein [Clostridium perfringens]